MAAKIQSTITREGSISGIGIHSGEKSAVFFRPAPVDTGIQFFRNGARIHSLKTGNPAAPIFEGQRRTSLKSNESQIETVEHVLAALTGLEISNIEIHVDGSEMPALDGSALPFVRLFNELKIAGQRAPREYYRVTEPIFCCDETMGGAIAVYPADEFSVAYVLDYKHPFLGRQKVDFTLSPGLFESEIAPARTFCTQEETAELRRQGFGLGAGLENTLVIGARGVVGNQFRFADECARHKVLDILGDLALLGFPILGRVVGLRSGHALNRKLVEQLFAQRKNTQRGAMDTKNKKEVDAQPYVMGFEEIKKVLPHRYPFLLVDRILELKDMSAVGIKNISGSEPFFQGHFPDKPVMPGVLMVEALAQVGGVLMLSKSENKGKLAYLASINDARFRKMVVPGDQLRLEIEVVKMKSKIGLVRGRATVKGEEVCSAEIMFSLGD